MKRVIGKIKLAMRKIQSMCLLRRVFIDYREVVSFRNQNTNVQLFALVEHIGDIVACEPIVRFLKIENPDVKVIWIVNQKYIELLAYNPNIDKIIAIECLSEWIYLKFFLLKFSKVNVTDLHMPNRLCSKYYLTLSNPNENGITIENYYERGSLLEAVSLIGNFSSISMAPQMYFPVKKSSLSHNLPKHYIVIQATSNESCRNWSADKWRELVLHFKTLTFVEVGLISVVTGCENCITQFCGKTTLLEVAEIIKSADLFIGVDSAFAHFANALSVSGVVLLGSYRNFDTYMPYTGNYANNVNSVILHHHGPVEKLPVEQVVDAIKDLYLKIA